MVAPNNIDPTLGPRSSLLAFNGKRWAPADFERRAEFESAFLERALNGGMLDFIDDNKDGGPPTLEDLMSLDAFKEDPECAEAHLSLITEQYNAGNEKLMRLLLPMLDYTCEQDHVEAEFIKKKDGFSLLRWALDDSHPSKPHVQKAIKAALTLSKRINWSANPDEIAIELYKWHAMWRITKGNKTHEFAELIEEIVENARERAPADAPIRQYLTFHTLMSTAGSGIEVTYTTWRDFVQRLKTFLRDHTPTSTGAAALLPLEGGERPPDGRVKWSSQERDGKMKELIQERNKCTRCDVFDCKAGSAKDKCIVFNCNAPIKGPTDGVSATDKRQRFVWRHRAFALTSGKKSLKGYVLKHGSSTATYGSARTAWARRPQPRTPPLPGPPTVLVSGHSHT
jgi:hypothetical protein